MKQRSSRPWRQANGASLPTRLAREIAQGAQAVIRTRTLVYPRMLWRTLRKLHRTRGEMRLPFGRIRYADADSLRTTYYQIFVQGIYQVDGLGNTPKIIDCGGNIGLSVIAFKRRYPQARIVVFEADPALAAILAWNIKSLGMTDVTIEAKAVGAANGQVLFQPDGAVDGHVIAPDGTTGHANTISVPAVRLSDLIDADEPVDLLKLDIEGSEYDVIADLSESGRLAQVRSLICEVHGNPATQRRFAELWRQLTEAGFRLSLNDARVGGEPRETPFPVIPGKDYAVIVYAWRP
jgi:FkbM family methyltransferase